MSRLIDLRSDTVTQPSPGMLQAMMSAPLGDDVFGEDPTTAKLEKLCAEMFGFEAGLFCPSGTMTNQIAVKVHTQPIDEIICDNLCHIYNYETGGWAFHSGVSIRLTHAPRGIMTPELIAPHILPDRDWFANTRLVCIENTVNKGGGSVYTLAEMKAVSDFCKSQNLLLHLDGARIFNALTALNETPASLHGLFDSVSVCLSKGLGAPAGSVLLGSTTLIRRARKIRKVMGGGMRQSGLLAAAGIYALQHHVEGLKQDHLHAQQLETTLRSSALVKNILPVETNIVIFETADAECFSQQLQQHDVLCQPFSLTQVRMVTHRDVAAEDIERVCAMLQNLD